MITEVVCYSDWTQTLDSVLGFAIFALTHLILIWLGGTILTRTLQNIKRAHSSKLIQYPRIFQWLVKWISIFTLCLLGYLYVQPILFLLSGFYTSIISLSICQGWQPSVNLIDFEGFFLNPPTSRNSFLSFLINLLTFPTVVEKPLFFGSHTIMFSNFVEHVNSFWQGVTTNRLFSSLISTVTVAIVTISDVFGAVDFCKWVNKRRKFHPSGNAMKESAKNWKTMVR